MYQNKHRAVETHLGGPPLYILSQKKTCTEIFYKEKAGVGK